MYKKIILSIIFILFLSFWVFPQGNANTGNKELTTEQLFLNNPEMMIIAVQASSDDRQSKIDALDGIEKMINEGTPPIEIEQILIDLGSEGTLSKKYEGKTLVNNFTEVRRRACELLGKLGGELAASSLVDVLKTDDEVMVLSEAAHALGVIGIDKDGSVVRALSAAITSQTMLEPDSNFAYAVIFALKKLAEKNNGLKDASGYNALIKIAQGNYINQIKKLALDTLREMKKYSK